MNREMILRVADAIEAAANPEAKPAFGFNMVTFGSETVNAVGGDKTGHACGTVGCIAGWAVALSDGGIPAYYSDADQQACELFGLTPDTADELFWAFGLRKPLHSVLPSQAVSVLRHLAETGDVDWSIAERGVVA